jgi:hypothetical protein
VIVARQSTARTVIVGPVLDSTGAAVTTAVVGDFKIAKNGGAPAALNASATLTHRHTGKYSLALTASDLDTVGQAEVTLDKTTDDCPVKELTVIEEAIYDALFAASANAWSGAAGSSIGTANVTQFGGSAGTFASGRPEVNASHWAGSAVATPTVAGVPEVDLTHWLGTAAATPTVAGVPEVDVTHFGGTAGTFSSGLPRILLANSASHGGTSAVITFERMIGASTTDGEPCIKLTGSSTGAGAGLRCSGGNPAGAGNGAEFTGGGGGGADFVLLNNDSTSLRTVVWTGGTRTVSAATNITSTGGSVPITAGGLVSADVAAISTDTTAADNAEAFFDGTGYAGTGNTIPTVTTLTNDPTGVTTLLSRATEARLAELDAANLPADVDQIKADLPTKPTRGVALTSLPFPMRLASDGYSPATGVTVTVQVSKDGGAFANSTNSAVEIGSGWYRVTLTATEMTADTVALKMTGSGCVNTELTIVTGAT